MFRRSSKPMPPRPSERHREHRISHPSVNSKNNNNTKKSSFTRRASVLLLLFLFLVVLWMILDIWGDETNMYYHELLDLTIPVHPHPLQVLLNYDTHNQYITRVDHVMTPTRAILLEPDTKHIPWNRNAQEHNDDDDNDNGKTCIPMGDWQKRTFPNCNTAHEINMRPETGSVHFINCGGDRCAFKLLDESGRPTMVLKIPKYKRDFGEHRYYAARKDGVAMERLQFSPYILDIYGFCGLSQVIELGDDGGNLHDLIKVTRLQKVDYMHWNDKLRIAYHLAAAVADMHGFEEDKRLVPITHNDICCHQFIFVNGIYKLNDFHLAQFQRKNKNTGDTCRSTHGYSNYFILIRSPEEIMSQKTHKFLEKTDVYTMGNLMYYALTMEWLFLDVSREEALTSLKNGGRSPIPEDLASTNNTTVKAVIHAMHWAWTHDPAERPHASQIRDYLAGQLKTVLRLNRELTVDDVRVHSVKPLPKDYRYSDSDFSEMFED